MNFYKFIQEFPNFRATLALPIAYDIDEKEIKFAREKYEEYLNAIPQEEQDILRPFYATTNNEFVIRMFTINFFNLSYMDNNDIIDSMYHTFIRMRKEYGSVTFFQGALPYPDQYVIKEEDLTKDGKKMSEIIPMRISKIDEFPKDAKVAVLMLGYINVNVLHCTVFISKDSISESLLKKIGESIQDEWKKYFLFSKNKKRSLFT